MAANTREMQVVSVKWLSLVASLLIALWSPTLALRAEQPKSYIIAGISVEGNTFADEQTIIALSGLRVGSEIRIPGAAMQEAVKSLWNRNQFSEVDIVIEKKSALGIFLIIKVKEYPRFSWVEIVGNDKIGYDDLKKAVDKVRGDIISPFDEYTIRQSVKKLYEKDGLLFAQVKSELIATDTPSYSRLRIEVVEGIDFHVKSVAFKGNEKLKSEELVSALSNTKTKSWWQFWSSDKFDRNKFDEDKKKLAEFFKTKGYIDATIVSDTVELDEARASARVTITIEEGRQYILRSISFEGATVYTEDQLRRRINIPVGQPYDADRFERNLFANEDQSDVMSLYMDIGYLNPQLVKEERRDGDSLDMVVRVFEGERFTINRVVIIGNTKTKDKVIRRELLTKPGDNFSRSAIIQSVRALGVLNYFNPEGLRPDVKPADKTSVDVVYRVEERSTDTFNASMGVAGTLGLTGSIGMTLNNFSIKEPLRGGGGQIMNLNLEFGQQGRFRNISVGFTEPWLNDEPTTLGVSLYDIRQNFGIENVRLGGQVNLGRRLRFPDDFFRIDGTLRLQRFSQGGFGTGQDLNNLFEVNLSSTLSRVSVDNLIFPTSGSRMTYTSSFSLGALGLGNTDFWKNQFLLEMFQPLMQIDGNNRLVFFLSTELGYVRGFNTDTTIPVFERYYMGGNGLGGFFITPLRGYVDRSIGPNQGGNVMSRYLAEMRFALSLNPMPIYVIAFAEAGNVWQNISLADPFDLKRSAGFGARILLNPIGLLGFDYGYGFDSPGRIGSPSGWQFHIQFGR